MDFKTIHIPTVTAVFIGVVALFIVYHLAFHMKGGK